MPSQASYEAWLLLWTMQKRKMAWHVMYQSLERRGVASRVVVGDILAAIRKDSLEKVMLRLGYGPSIGLGVVVEAYQHKYHQEIRYWGMVTSGLLYALLAVTAVGWLKDLSKPLLGMEATWMEAY